MTIGPLQKIEDSYISEKGKYALSLDEDWQILKACKELEKKKLGAEDKKMVSCPKNTDENGTGRTYQIKDLLRLCRKS